MANEPIKDVLVAKTETDIPKNLDGRNLAIIKTENKILFIDDDGSTTTIGGKQSDGNDRGIYESLQELESQVTDPKVGNYARAKQPDGSIKTYIYDLASRSWQELQQSGRSVESVNGVTPDSAGRLQLSPANIGLPSKDDIATYTGSGKDLNMSDKGDIILGGSKSIKTHRDDGTAETIASAIHTPTGTGNTATTISIGSQTSDLTLVSKARPKASVGGATKEIAFKDDVADISPSFATAQDINDKTPGKIITADLIDAILSKVQAQSSGVFVDSGVKMQGIVGTTDTFGVDMTKEQAEKTFPIGSTVKLVSADLSQQISGKVVEITEGDSGEVFIKVDVQVGESMNGGAIATTQPYMPHDGNIVKPTSELVIGVVFTNRFDEHGVVLKHINENFEEIAKPETGWFNEHPAYKFEDRMDGVNYMVRVPIAYWKRGRVPEGKPNAGQRYLLISPTKRDGFKCSRAFMKDGALQDALLYGKYRGSHQNGRIVSQPNKPHASSKGDTGTTSGRSFQEQQQMCEANGNGYHMSTVFEYHEILLRAVVEMGTFDLYPMNVRQDKSKNIYRLIEEMAYDGYTDTSTRDSATLAEWRDGLRAQQQMSSDSQNYLEIWDAQGRRTWTATQHKCKDSGISGYITELEDEAGLDEIIMASQTRSTDKPVSVNDIALISDGQYATYATTSYPCIAHSHFNAGYANNGAFNLNVSNAPSYSDANYGSRPAKV